MLEESFFETPSVRWRRLFPWLRLVRSARLALDHRSLLLALLGVLIFAAGRQAIARLPFSPASLGVVNAETAVAWPWQAAFLPPSPATQSAARLSSLAAHPGKAARQALSQTHVVLEPARYVLRPARELLRTRATWPHVAWAWTELLLALAVWALFGGAIARIAALDAAGAPPISLRGSLNFSREYYLSSLGGPLLPALGVGLLCLINGLAGLATRIPVVGESIVGALGFIPLFVGVLLALIMIGVAVGWPLMITAIAVEASDAFDALSRAYSYVFSRPWYALFLGALATVYGSVVLWMLYAVAGFAVELTNWSTALGAPDGAISPWRLASPSQFIRPGEGLVPPEAPSAAGSTGGAWGDSGASPMVGFWLRGLATLLAAYVVSFFWTACTQIYLLLRLAEDAAPIDAVYLPSGGPDAQSAPAAAVPHGLTPPGTGSAGSSSAGPALSGMAAAEQRERARSAASAAGNSPRPTESDAPVTESSSNAPGAESAT